MPNIILGVTGSVALYKSCELLRSLIKDDFSVKIVLTENARKLISPQLFVSLGAEAVYSSLFLDNFSGQNEYHIPLEKWADLLLIAPCTANTLSKCAQGIADNLLTTLFMSTLPEKVLIAPAMHSQMWLSPAIRRNREILSSWGVGFIGPDEGPLASGDTGIGRFASIDEILGRVRLFFNTID